MKKLAALTLVFCLFLSACSRNPSPDTQTTTDGWTIAADDTSAPSASADTDDTQPSDNEQTSGSQPSQGGASGTQPPGGGQAVTPAPTLPPNTPPGEVRVVIPEGFRFMQIAQRLEANGICTAKAFYDAAQRYEVQSFTVPKDPNRCFKMEGYLFPATYVFPTNSDPVDVLRAMLNAYAQNSGKPDEKTLILASIIQQEVRSEQHMKMVSSVYHNRLNAGNRLESDPTREYVNDFITGNPLVANQAKYAPLYNTYRDSLKGKLPAGPICSPGRAAIEAAKNPTPSEYFFFYFGVDNKNHYSVTYEEHLQKLKEIPADLQP